MVGRFVRLLGDDSISTREVGHYLSSLPTCRFHHSIDLGITGNDVNARKISHSSKSIVRAGMQLAFDPLSYPGNQVWGIHPVTGHDVFLSISGASTRAVAPIQWLAERLGIELPEVPIIWTLLAIDVDLSESVVTIDPSIEVYSWFPAHTFALNDVIMPPVFQNRHAVSLANFIESGPSDLEVGVREFARLADRLGDIREF